MLLLKTMDIGGVVTKRQLRLTINLLMMLQMLYAEVDAIDIHHDEKHPTIICTMMS